MLPCGVRFGPPATTAATAEPGFQLHVSYQNNYRVSIIPTTCSIGAIDSAKARAHSSNHIPVLQQLSLCLCTTLLIAVEGIWPRRTVILHPSSSIKTLPTMVQKRGLYSRRFIERRCVTFDTDTGGWDTSPRERLSGSCIGGWKCDLVASSSMTMLSLRCIPQSRKGDQMCCRGVNIEE